MGLGLFWLGNQSGEVAEEPPLDVEIVQRANLVVPEPEPEPEPAPEPEPEPASVPEVSLPPRDRPPRDLPRVENRVAQPDLPAPEPAPGPVTDSQPAPTWVMPDQGSGGSIPISRGTPTTRRVGPGGTGTGTGGGGRPESSGTAVARPVSIASIKKRPMPIGDTDFVDAHQDYPPEARRLAIEGTIKVRLVVDETGVVSQRKLLTQLGHGLDELALKLAARLRFSPAIDSNDNPVAAIVVWTFHFTLPG